jgi:hypothetical protein
MFTWPDFGDLLLRKVWLGDRLGQKDLFHTRGDQQCAARQRGRGRASMARIALSLHVASNGHP